jgi:hypothetical protein
MAVRRASDNAVLPIGFDGSGNLDTATLASFCSGTNGFVAVWYDQSGNGKHATQATTSAQPKIYDSSAEVLTENGSPYIKYGVLTTILNFGANNWMFAAAGNLSDNSKLFLASSGANYMGIMESGNASTTVNSNAGTLTAYKDGNTYNFTTRDGLYTDIGTQSLFTLKQENSNWTNVKLGYSNDVSQRCWSMHEVVIYDTDQSANRTGIEANINAYYSIYP